MTETTNLRLPCIQGSQAQKHVTHNEALRILDTLVHLAVIDRDLTAPPEHTFEGDRYIVNAEATGAWAGCEGAIMARQDGAWHIIAPRPGWLAYVIDEGALLVWSGSAWIDAISALASLNNVTRLGVGTTADLVNPFSAKLNNALFTARTVAEGGDGDLRHKLNKESAAHTASLLFQAGYSGRAEMGLIGDDDFRFKVSPDGGTWHDGIVINRNSGAVTFPNSTLAGGREILGENRTYYVRSDGADTNNGLADTVGGAFATIQRAIDAACALDLSVYNVTIRVADGTYTGAITLKSFVGAGTISIVGNSSAPANVTVTVSSAGCVTANAVVGQWLLDGMKLVASTPGHNALTAALGSIVSYRNINFGVANQHISVTSGACVMAIGNTTISGNANIHWYAASGGYLQDRGVTITLSGTPAFAQAFAYAQQNAVLSVNGNTFSGSATGTRYTILTGGLIDTNGGGANYLPGNAAGSGGTASGGGWYN